MPKKNSVKRQKRYKRDFDTRARLALAPTVGDFVYAREDPNAKGKHKLSSRADGPYRVVGVSSDEQTVEIRRAEHDE